MNPKVEIKLELEGSEIQAYGDMLLAENHSVAGLRYRFLGVGDKQRLHRVELTVRRKWPFFGNGNLCIAGPWSAYDERGRLLVSGDHSGDTPPAKIRPDGTFIRYTYGPPLRRGSMDISELFTMEEIDPADETKLRTLAIDIVKERGQWRSSAWVGRWPDRWEVQFRCAPHGASAKEELRSKIVPIIERLSPGLPIHEE